MIRGASVSVMLVLLLVGFSSAVDISSCRSFNTQNTVYRLTADVSSSGTCFTVAANNVTLDCQLHEINYAQSSVGYAVGVNGAYTGLAVRNCDIVQASSIPGSHAIFLDEAKNSVIEDNYFVTYGDFSYGVLMMEYAESNTLRRNYVTTSGEGATGIYADYLTDAIIAGNEVTTSGDKSYGIYVWHTEGQSLIEDNLIDTSGALAYGIPMDYSADLEVRGNVITTDGSQSHCIQLRSSSGNSLSGNDVTASGSSAYGIEIDEDSDSNTITDSQLESEQSYGVYLQHDGSMVPENNILYNNLIKGTTPVGFSSTHGANTWNTPKKTGTRIYSSGTQIGGNYYSLAAGFGYSDTCADANRDGFCDSALPLAAGNVDNLPLSDEYATPTTTTTSTTSTTTTSTTRTTTTTSTTTISVPSTSSTTTTSTTTVVGTTTSTTLSGDGGGGGGGGGGNVSLSCFDGIQNQNETGVDCGGPCAPCVSCIDDVQNQGEEGIDCGGPCAPCPTLPDASTTLPSGGSGGGGSGGGGGGSGGGGSGGGGVPKPRVSCFDGIRNQNESGVDCGGPCSPCMNCSDGIQNQGELGVDCGGPCPSCPRILADGRYYVNENMTLTVEFARVGLVVSVKEPGAEAKYFTIPSVDAEQKYVFDYTPSREGMVQLKVVGYDERYAQVHSRQIIPILEDVPPEVRSLFIPFLLFLAASFMWTHRRTKAVVDEQILDGFKLYPPAYGFLSRKHGRFYTAAEKLDDYGPLENITFIELNSAEQAEAEGLSARYGVIPEMGRALALCKKLKAKTYLTSYDLPEELQNSFQGTKVIRP